MDKKVLVVLTNVTRYGDTDDPTGLWLGEAAEFVDEMNKANVKVDYVSPKGGFVPLDPRSMKYTDASIMKIYDTKDFQDRALRNSKNPDEINPKDYDAIYFTGGHGVMWDFPDDASLQEISREIYQNNGYLTSVCHGIAGLLNIQDDKGQYLIKDKNITGFTKSEEIIAGKMKVVPFLNKEVATQRGANFKQKRFYKEYAIEDGQFITGQNPFSARAVARLLIKQFNQK